MMEEIIAANEDAIGILGVLILFLLYLLLFLLKKKPYTLTCFIRSICVLLFDNGKETKKAKARQCIDLNTKCFDALLEFLCVAIIWQYATEYTASWGLILSVSVIISFLSISFLLCLWGVLLYFFFDHDKKSGNGKQTIKKGEFIGFALLVIMMLVLLLPYHYTKKYLSYVFFNASVFLITTDGISITLNERVEEAKRLSNQMEETNRSAKQRAIDNDVLTHIEGKAVLAEHDAMLTANNKTMIALIGLFLQMIGTCIVIIDDVQSFSECIELLLIIFTMTYAIVSMAKILSLHTVSKYH